MKIGVLSHKTNKNIQDLIEAARKRNHKARFIANSSLETIVSPEGAFVSENGTPLDLDIAYIRGFPSNVSLRCLYNILKNQNVRIVDERIIQTYDNNNKLYTHMKLRTDGLPTPRTFYAYTPDQYSLRDITEKIKSDLPIITKVAFSSQGKGVYLLTSEKEYRILLAKLSTRQKRQLIFQPYIEHSGDIRIHVIGEKVIGAMYRKKQSTDFRSNIAVGASGEPYELTTNLEELALRAAKIADFEIAGVDIIMNKQQPIIIEINRAPQFQGFKEATGINPAEEIISYFENTYT